MENNKGTSIQFLDTRTFQEVAHEIFIENSDYSVKELAFFLGEEMSATYKFLEGVRPIRVDWARRVIQFVGMKNAKDTRLADFFCGVAGFMAVPRIKGKRGEAIQAIMTDIAELTKGNVG